MVELYDRNKKKNKQIAMAILGVLIADALGILEAVGFSLENLGIAGWSLKQILLVAGLGWIIYGLHKFKIG